MLIRGLADAGARDRASLGGPEDQLTRELLPALVAALDRGASAARGNRRWSSRRSSASTTGGCSPRARAPRRSRCSIASSRARRTSSSGGASPSSWTCSRASRRRFGERRCARSRPSRRPTPGRARVWGRGEPRSPRPRGRGEPRSPRRAVAPLDAKNVSAVFQALIQLLGANATRPLVVADAGFLADVAAFLRVASESDVPGEARDEHADARGTTGFRTGSGSTPGRSDGAAEKAPFPGSEEYRGGVLALLEALSRCAPSLLAVPEAVAGDLLPALAETLAKTDGSADSRFPRAEARVRRRDASAVGEARRGERGARFGSRDDPRADEIVAPAAVPAASAGRGPDPSVRAEAFGRRGGGGRGGGFGGGGAGLGAGVFRVSLARAHQQQRAQRPPVPRPGEFGRGARGEAPRVRRGGEGRGGAQVRARERGGALPGARAGDVSRGAAARVPRKGRGRRARRGGARGGVGCAAPLVELAPTLLERARASRRATV